MKKKPRKKVAVSNKKRTVLYELTLCDRETGKVLYTAEASFSVTPAEEKSPRFSVALLDMENEFVASMIQAKWAPKRKKKRKGR